MVIRTVKTIVEVKGKYIWKGVLKSKSPGSLGNLLTKKLTISVSKQKITPNKEAILRGEFKSIKLTVAKKLKKVKLAVGTNSIVWNTVFESILRVYKKLIEKGLICKV